MVMIHVIPYRQTKLKQTSSKFSKIWRQTNLLLSSTNMSKLMRMTQRGGVTVLKEWINIKVDELAKNRWRRQWASIFPNKQVWIEMGGKKILASPRLELEDFWGHEIAKKFFHEKKIVLATHFDSIW
jgi:hypothetical protein